MRLLNTYTMPIEIERKYLVIGDAWRSLATPKLYKQGYIYTENSVTVRVRLIEDQGYLTLKGKRKGASRAEFEYSIPTEDARIMLDTLCDRPLIEKKRYRIELDDDVWEIDEFFGDNQGLILAEIELSSEEQTIHLPEWVGQEVTEEKKYYNSYLARHPYQDWESR